MPALNRGPVLCLLVLKSELIETGIHINAAAGGKKFFHGCAV